MTYLLNSAELHHGKNQNKRNPNRCHHPLITHPNTNISFIIYFSSYQDDRASVFPHGRNLNLLILVVVGASATASLIVGGLIFALASRRRGVAKNVSKLQLSDDIEESGKLEQQQEGYKVLIILLFKVF